MTNIMPKWALMSKLIIVNLIATLWGYDYTSLHCYVAGEYDSHVDGNRCAWYYQKTSGPDYNLIEGPWHKVQFEFPLLMYFQVENGRPLRCCWS